MTLVTVAGAIGLMVLLLGVGLFNSLVSLRNEVKNGWAQIDVQLKRRHDLIPNLIETVKGYAAHERETLDRVVRARAQAQSASTMDEKAAAENALSKTIRQFLVVVENYPDLKANSNFLALQEELKGTENRIAFSRQNYNDQVLLYNNRVQMFPSNLLAAAFSFNPEKSFLLDDAAERANPQVRF